ncbi:uncharacterized protein LY79DRAFT_184271 [Colletotrichum navitas]|uniref:Uncharacterized protein n=1 Tax=Colletotrichum navitas TaxID=681940 RepID=A0AAD8Q005_9PEZI|nr:uncharacterized protein LY79DRAFT_184271 [Colletotrichum navitas]KAK1593326.1 hypothetical protein LY79DRAFT_184271 [Colletotrichum navitas]
MCFGVCPVLVMLTIATQPRIETFPLARNRAVLPSELRSSQLYTLVRNPPSHQHESVIPVRRKKEKKGWAWDAKEVMDMPGSADPVGFLQVTEGRERAKRQTLYTPVCGLRLRQIAPHIAWPRIASSFVDSQVWPPTAETLVFGSSHTRLGPLFSFIFYPPPGLWMWGGF